MHKINIQYLTITVSNIINYNLKFQVMVFFTSEKQLKHGNEERLSTSVNYFIYIIYLTDCVGIFNFIYFIYKLELYKLMLLKFHGY